jgi:hypothetical protein
LNFSPRLPFDAGQIARGYRKGHRISYPELQSTEV